MIVPPGFHQFKTFSQLLGKTRRVASVDWQPAAFLWTVDCKRSDDDMTAGPDSLLMRVRHLMAASWQATKAIIRSGVTPRQSRDHISSDDGRVSTLFGHGPNRLT